MTDITQQALEAAQAHILKSYRTWQADDISAVPPSGSSAGKVLALISAALSRPIDPKAEVEPVAWLHPTANRAHVDRERVAIYCAKDGPHPIPLYTSPSIVAPVGVTEEMVNAAYRVINESWWSESWDADVPKGLSRRALEAALAAAPALTPAEKAGVADGWKPIDTADKDAESLMLGIVRRGVLEEIHIGGYRYAYNDDEVSCWWSDQADDEIFPTHWAKLPEFATKPAQGDGEKLRNAANALCKVAFDLDLGRSVHNSRFPEQPIEGPLWKKLMEAASEVADILAPAALAAQGDDA